jgi:hypothetical protein
MLNAIKKTPIKASINPWDDLVVNKQMFAKKNLGVKLNIFNLF